MYEDSVQAIVGGNFEYELAAVDDQREAAWLNRKGADCNFPPAGALEAYST